MKQPGELAFQCGDTTLGISRIKLEWLQSSTGLSSPAITDTLVTPADGKTRLAGELDGQPAAEQDPAWHKRIVDVPITTLPLRIEQGVDFAVQMDGLPARARLSLNEAGLPWGQHLVVWLNGQRTGVVQTAAPPLGDAGYPASAGSAYVGWREGTFYVPVGLLVTGTDTLQFSAEPDVAPPASSAASITPVPLAVKNVLLELDFPATSTATATAASTANPETTDAVTATSSSPVDESSMPAPNPQNPGLLSLPLTTTSSTP
jgi:hypothetical protein